MARVPYTALGSTPFRRLLAYNPELLQAFAAIDEAVSNKLSLPEDLREEVRRHLAYDRGCRY